MQQCMEHHEAVWVLQGSLRYDVHNGRIPSFRLSNLFCSVCVRQCPVRPLHFPFLLFVFFSGTTFPVTCEVYSQSRDNCRIFYSCHECGKPRHLFWLSRVDQRTTTEGAVVKQRRSSPTSPIRMLHGKRQRTNSDLFCSVCVSLVRPFHQLLFFVVISGTTFPAICIVNSQSPND